MESLAQFEAARGRKPRVVVLDPLDGVVYSRSVRRGGAGLYIDPALQELFDDKGQEALAHFAVRNYHGYAVAVVPDGKLAEGSR